MSNKMPIGWATARLGELCVERVQQHEATDGAVPYIDIGSINRDTKVVGRLQYVTRVDAPTRARQWVCAGDVLVSMTRPNLNAVAIVPPMLDGAVASTGFDVLRAIEVLPQWVFSRVRSHDFVVDVCEGLQGVVYPAIRPHDVRQHKMPVPPLPEQHRIIESIESHFTRLDEAVATLERAQRNLKRYRASVIKAAVEGRLVPTEDELARAEHRDYEPASVLLERILVERRGRWEASRHKGKYEAPAAPDLSDLPKLPKGWCWANIGQLGLISSGQTPSGIAGCLKTAGEIPWFRIGDMNTEGNEAFMLHARDWLTRGDLEKLRLHVRPEGTIIFPKRGGAIATNKKRRLSRPSAYDLNTMGIVPVGPVHAYLWVWFLGLDLGSLSDGSNVPQINNGDVEPLPVPLPPLAEQHRIAGEVDLLISVIEDANAIVMANQTRCQHLRQSILKWAFEGKLADQDPNDEPASALLERIKAERAAAIAIKKSRRLSEDARGAL